MISKKWILLVLGLVFILAFATACGGDEEEPAEEPAAEEPVAEQPIAEGEAEPMPEADKWCSDTNIVFFPGGSPGGPFATVV